MKTTLELPDELMREAKLRAVAQGRTLKDLVADCIRQGLGLAPPLPSSAGALGDRVLVVSNGLPVIRCRADAPVLRANLQDLLALEQQAQTEEDMQHAGRPVRHQRLARCGIHCPPVSCIVEPVREQPGRDRTQNSLPWHFRKPPRGRRWQTPPSS